mmetsp:Transcript_58930/g.127458  ORF Transcript_58930/g.127458 Transcript_58930/m.127458 type:complete len:755 (-) Transcript_58930:126-2390(-)
MSVTDDGTEDSSYLIPSVEAMGVSLLYGYEMPKFTFFRSATELDYKYSTGDITTAICHANGSLWKVVNSSAEITLSLPEILTLSGRPGVLDEVQDRLGTNKLPGALTAKGPFGRVSGVATSILIKCGNVVNPVQGCTTLPFVEGPICTLTTQVRQAWASREDMGTVDNSVGAVYRKFHGVRVTIDKGGENNFWDFAAVFNSFVALIVLYRIPMHMVLFIMVRMLGQLSLIYRRVLWQVFDITEQVSGMVLRMTANTLLFSKLTDEADGISIVRLGALLRQALSHRAGTLDFEEQQRFVNFCFTAICVPKEAQRDHMQMQAKLDRDQRGKIDLKTLHIDVDQFLTSSTSNEKLPLAQVVNLFDTDRRKSILERLFTPQDLSTAFAANTHVDQSLIEAVTADATVMNTLGNSAATRTIFLPRLNPGGGPSQGSEMKANLSLKDSTAGSSSMMRSDLSAKERSHIGHENSNAKKDKDKSSGAKHDVQHYTHLAVEVAALVDKRLAALSLDRLAERLAVMDQRLKSMESVTAESDHSRATKRTEVSEADDNIRIAVSEASDGGAVMLAMSSDRRSRAMELLKRREAGSQHHHAMETLMERVDALEKNLQHSLAKVDEETRKPEPKPVEDSTAVAVLREHADALQERVLALEVEIHLGENASSSEADSRSRDERRSRKALRTRVGDLEAQVFDEKFRARLRNVEQLVAEAAFVGAAQRTTNAMASRRPSAGSSWFEEARPTPTATPRRPEPLDAEDGVI